MSVTPLKKRFAAICTLAILAATASAEAKPAAKGSAQRREPAACAALHNDYEMSSKKLALYSAQSAVGGTAARGRATSQTETTMSEAKMTLDLLRGNGCRMPTAAPSRDRYLMQGLTCVGDMVGATGLAPSCVLENWKPEK